MACPERVRRRDLNCRVLPLSPSVFFPPPRRHVPLHREGKTIFITSHVLSDLQEMCTSVAIREKGNLLRVGSIDDVLRSRVPLSLNLRSLLPCVY